MMKSRFFYCILPKTRRKNRITDIFFLNPYFSILGIFLFFN